jgi:hypothetical protein
VARLAKRLVLLWVGYKAFVYLYGWTRVPLEEPHRKQWAWFLYQIVSGYPPGELDHWTD